MIVKVPDLVLTTPAKNVGKIDKKILDIVDRMKKTLVGTRHPKGVGLAAPQIGIGLKIFITRPTKNDPSGVFLNPEITYRSLELAEISRIDTDKKSKANEKKLEGCLSIPNVWGYLKRPKVVKLRFTNLKGKSEERHYSDFLSTIVQHETDHLQGILFTQRVLEQNQKFYRIEKNNQGEEKLIEIEL